MAQRDFGAMQDGAKKLASTPQMNKESIQPHELTVADQEIFKSLLEKHI